MNSRNLHRQTFALAVVIFMLLLLGSRPVFSQSVTFAPNGVWFPSMTTNERLTMTVTMGQVVFDTGTRSIWYHTGKEWKELTVTRPPADNLGDHTATQHLNLGGFFLSPDGSSTGLKISREQLLLQLNKPRFQLGTNLSPTSQLNFANYDRNWTISTSQERFAITDSTFQTSPIVIEKNVFHNMLYLKGDKLGIGTTNPYEKLDVAGKVKMNGFQLYNGDNTAGYILQSDSGGNGLWVNAVTAGLNYWTLANGFMYPNQNVNVGIGTETPSAKLDVNGKLRTTDLDVTSKTKTASLEVTGTTKTTNFQLTNGASNGYILQSDANGNALWKDPASLPISFTETDPKVGALSSNTLPKWNGTKLSDGTIVDNGNIGIGVASPINKLEVAGTTKTTNFQLTNGATNGYILQSDVSGNALWKDPTTLPISFTETDPKVGVLSSNVLPKWNGTKLSDGTIVDNGNIGIGVASPTNKLEVAGTTKTTNLQLTNGASNGYILQSDASGNALWKDPSSLPISFTETDPKVGALSSNILPKWNGTKLSDGTIVDNGNIGIGVASPINKLEVAGTTKTTNLQLTNGASNGYILQSDASGNALWKDPTTLPISFTETDPKVGALSSNILPKWNGTKLSDGTIVDNGNIGIGVASPTNKLEVLGTTKTTDLQLTNGATNGYILQSDASGNALWKDPSSLPISFTETDPKVGALSSNILPKWNGTKLSDGSIIDNGNIGIGVASPTNKLEVAGTTKTTNFQLTNGASNGYILQSDANGNALWKDPSSLPISFTETDPKVGALSSNILPKWNGTKLSDGTIVDNGNIGIGVASPTNKLEVAGTTKTTDLQLTNGATNGYILQSDASGIASWVNPTSLPNGNWIKSGVNQYSALSGNVGIGTNTPSAKLDVNGDLKVNAGIIVDANGTNNGTNINTISFGISSGEAIGSVRTTGHSNRYGLDFYTDHEPRMSIAHWGGVGIGTNTPANYLDVSGSLAVGLSFAGSETAPDNGAIIEGNVGIGTSFALFPLTVFGTDNQMVGVISNSVSGTSMTIGNTSGSSSEWAITASGTGNAGGSGQLLFQDKTGNTAMMISSDNNVGIGTTNANSRLTVGENYASNISSIAQFNTKNNAAVMFGETTNHRGLMIGYDGNDIQGRSGNDFDINDDLLLNQYGGNVGIGTNEPTEKLEVDGKIKTVRLQITNGAGDNYILKSDASGNAAWTSPSVLETDPKMGSLTTNYLPKWNGSTLANTQVFDNGTNVGVGTTTPTQAKFVVNGNASNTLSYAYLNSSGTGTSSSATNTYSIYASSRIAASEFNAFSDARIKDIKGVSNNEEDLETLSKIKITDYQFKDKIGKGNGQYKKVISQQVETVYPQAISKVTDCIPDIYQLAKIENNFVELPKHSLKVGERVKLIFGDRQGVFEVESVNENGFKIVYQNAEIINSTSVFVYGREVSDFRSVDYEALSTLNISATQALLKRMEQLETENKQYKQELKSFGTELQQLKTMILTMTASQGKEQGLGKD